MMRFIFLLLFCLLGVVAFIWFSTQQVPNWYIQAQANSQHLSAKAVTEKASHYLGAKFTSLLKGELSLRSEEVKTLIVLGLHKHAAGRKIAPLIDSLNARFIDKELEVGILVDLKKIGQLNAKAKQAVASIRPYLPLVKKDKVYVSIRVSPYAKAGDIYLKQDFALSIGKVPVQSAWLEEVGMDSTMIQQFSLPIQNVFVQSIAIGEEYAVLKVRPRF